MHIPNSNLFIVLNYTKYNNENYINVAVSKSKVLGEPMEKTCPITKILGDLSKKWTLLILRELHNNGIKRFNELIRDMKNISPRTLSKRLKELEKLGLVSKRRFNETPPKVEYSLTNKGKELIKCFKHLNIWVKKFEVKPTKSVNAPHYKQSGLRALAE